MSVLTLVSNGDIQRSNGICSQDQHAQAQHWLRHAQAQLMHAQAQPYLISPAALAAVSGPPTASFDWRGKAEPEHADLGYIF